jgi:hypothetical protein
MPGNRVLTDNALLIVVCQPEASDMNDLCPDRFTLRQADAAREACAQVMEELDLIKEQLARLPTRSETLRLALGCLAAVVVALLLIR